MQLQSCPSLDLWSLLLCCLALRPGASLAKPLPLLILPSPNNFDIALQFVCSALIQNHRGPQKISHPRFKRQGSGRLSRCTAKYTISRALQIVLA
jgi:hypothetical protein